MILGKSGKKYVKGKNIFVTCEVTFFGFSSKEAQVENTETHRKPQ